MSKKIESAEKKKRKDGTVRHYAHYSDGTSGWTSEKEFNKWLSKKNKNAPVTTKEVKVATKKSTVREEDTFNVDDKDLGEMLDGVGAWLYPTSEPSPYWPDEGDKFGGQILVASNGVLKVNSSNERTKNEGRQFQTGRQLAEGLPALVMKLAGELGLDPQQIAQHLCEKIMLSVAKKAGVDIKPSSSKSYKPHFNFKESNTNTRSPVVKEPAGIIPSQHEAPPSWVTLMSKAYDAYKLTHPDNDDEAVEKELEAQ